MPLTLLIDGQRHEGWTSGTVTRALETISGTFQVVVSDRAPGEATPRPIRPGQFVRVLLDADTVITGWVDGVSTRYDANSHELTITGRDRTGDLVDCSAASEPGEWHDEGLEAIVKALVAPFGISVSTNADTGAAFRRFRVEEGETVYEAIERACRFRGVLPLSDGQGGVVLGRPSRNRASTQLRFGDNILAATGTISWTDRYSDYLILGQQPGNNFFSPEEIAHVRAEARDPGVSRHRPLTVVAEQGMDTMEAETRINWEAVVRTARSRSATVTVAGWRQQLDGGDLWQPGQLVDIVDPLLGLNREMLVSTVQQSISGAGTLSALTLYPEDAFLPRIDTQRASTEDQRTGWWD